MREKISENIEKLMSRYSKLHTEKEAKEFNEEIAFVQDSLYEALNSTDAFDSKDQLSSYIFEDKDPIGKVQAENVSEIESFVECVREIQNDILDEFVEFTVARCVDLIKQEDE